MTSLMQNRVAVSVAVVVPCAVALWLWTTAAAAVPSTYAFVALLLLSMAVIGFNTWNNGQPTGSMAQVLHEADITPATAGSRPADRSGGTLRDIWLSRGDALAATGQVRALLALSALVTGALLLYAWIM